MLSRHVINQKKQIRIAVQNQDIDWKQLWTFRDRVWILTFRPEKVEFRQNFEKKSNPDKISGENRFQRKFLEKMESRHFVWENLNSDSCLNSDPSPTFHNWLHIRFSIYQRWAGIDPGMGILSLSRDQFSTFIPIPFHPAKSHPYPSLPLRNYPVLSLFFKNRNLALKYYFGWKLTQ